VVAHITAAEQHYPTGAATSRTGFVLMARQLADGGDDYQFVTVAYRKSDANNTARLWPITCNVSGKTVTGGSNLRVGSPLINRATGEYAFLESVTTSGVEGMLDRNMSTSGGISAYVLVEAHPMPGGQPPQPLGLSDMRRSPAIGTLSRLTGLNPIPNP